MPHAFAPLPAARLPPRFDADGRAELFSLINQHPTVYEVVTGRVARNKVGMRQRWPRAKGDPALRVWWAAWPWAWCTLITQQAQGRDSACG